MIDISEKLFRIEENRNNREVIYIRIEEIYDKDIKEAQSGMTYKDAKAFAIDYGMDIYQILQIQVVLIVQFKQNEFILGRITDGGFQQGI